MDKMKLVTMSCTAITAQNLFTCYQFGEIENVISTTKYPS